MTKRTIIYMSWLVLSGCVILMGLSGLLLNKGALKPQSQGALAQPRIYAYRDWQSTGVQVQRGDRLYLRARGEWLYTPDEFHGPEGHARYPAPDFYPVPYVQGGILIGRYGEDGTPFVVGRGGNYTVINSGMLYMRINDDVLSDNRGYVEVEITVTRPTVTP